MLVCVQREVRGWHVGVCSKGGEGWHVGVCSKGGEGMACWCVFKGR